MDFEIVVLPIGESHNNYALVVAQDLRKRGWSVGVFDSSTTLQRRLRDQLTKHTIPLIAIVGDDEIASDCISLRTENIIIKHILIEDLERVE